MIRFDQIKSFNHFLWFVLISNQSINYPIWFQSPLSQWFWFDFQSNFEWLANSPESHYLQQIKSFSVQMDKPKFNRHVTLLSLDSSELESSAEKHPKPEPVKEDSEQDSIIAQINDVEPICSSSLFSCFEERPLWKLFTVMTINGLLSLASSAIILSLEKPAQDLRLNPRY